MDYENFKEQFVADVKDRLEEQGADVKVSVNEVNKLNESYEAITVTPEDSNIGVNMSTQKFYDAMQDGTPYDDVVFFSIDPGYRGKDGEVSTQYANMHANPDEKVLYTGECIHHWYDE